MAYRGGLLALVIISLPTTSLTAAKCADASTCRAPGRASQPSREGLQKVSAIKLFKLVSKPDGKSLQKAYQFVKERHVNVSATLELVDGAFLPLVLAVVNLYMNQDAERMSLKEYKARKRKILQILSEMFAAGADPNTLLRGRHLLEIATELGDVKFCRCLIRGGARLSNKHGFLYRWLAYGWGSSAPVAEIVKGSVALRAQIAAEGLDTIHRKLHERYLHMFDISPKYRKLVVDADTSAAVGDYLQSDILDILADMLEAFLSEFTSAVDFQDVVAGHQSKSGRNVFHFVACSAPRSILAFSRAALSAGTMAARATLRMLQVGNALGRTPFHIAVACSSISFAAFLTAAEELSAAAGITFQSQAFLAALPKDNSGLSYLESMGSTEKIQNDELFASARHPYNSKLNGGWSVRMDGSPESDVTPPGGCDILVSQSPLPARNFTRAVILSKPVLLRGEALSYDLRKRWRRKSFLKRHGHCVFNVGQIPYADVFGLASEDKTVKDYLSSFAKASTSKQNGSSAPSYAFGKSIVKQNPSLQNDIEREPYVLKDLIIDGKPVAVSEPQFYLGPPHSGAPMHFHKDAVNILVYGRKRWFLRPPAEALYSTRPTAEWMSDINSKDNFAKPWECVQEAGDVIFVPRLWSHATLNVEESIGVAYEFEAPTVTAFE